LYLAVEQIRIEGDQHRVRPAEYFLLGAEDLHALQARIA